MRFLSPFPSGSSRSRDGCVSQATHGVALLLGVVVWYVSDRERAPVFAEPSEVAQQLHSSDPTTQATAWIDASLAKMRSQKNAAEAENARPLTKEKFLKDRRQESEKYRREKNNQLDQIVARANAIRGIADPIAALHAAQRDENDTDEQWVVVQYWLGTDTDAALAEIGRNWPLLENDYLPALLERKFGIAGIMVMIANEETPYRLRTSLAAELGRQTAYEAGLEDLLKYYHSIADPELRSRMTSEFSSIWPRDEPESVARILMNEAPKELRDRLVKRWVYENFGPESGEVIWLKELYPRLGLGEFTYSGQASFGMCGVARMSDDEESMKRWQARQLMTFDEIVQDCMKEKTSQKDAVEQAISIKMNHALEDGPDLIELFGEGQMTREELLAELHRKIPESNAHPDALERDAWQRTAWAADPREVAQWAAELSKRGDMDELIEQTFSSGGIYGDPRIPLRLERYRLVSQAMKDDRSRGLVLGHAAWEWTRWQAVSPPAAETWRDGLPKSESLYGAIREEEELERRRKGS